jgi:hypothetical protein
MGCQEQGYKGERGWGCRSYQTLFMREERANVNGVLLEVNESSDV